MGQKYQKEHDAGYLKIQRKTSISIIIKSILISCGLTILIFMYKPLQNDSQKMMDAVVKRFENPDEIRVFEKGKFELLHLPGMTIGRATYKPGWKWSIDVSPLSETKFCNVEHLGMVIEGRATVAFDKKEIITLIPGDVFYVSPKPHDSWVVGDKDYVSIHFLGADSYAT